jgi:hypothetical protein
MGLNVTVELFEYRLVGLEFGQIDRKPIEIESMLGADI